MNRLTRWESNHTLLHRGMQLDVVALWRSLIDYIIQTQEEHGVPRTNIMKYRLRGVYRALPFALFSQNRHRLHRLARDDFDEFPFPNLQHHTIFQYDMLFVALFAINFKGTRFNGSSRFSITCC